MVLLDAFRARAGHDRRWSPTIIASPSNRMKPGVSVHFSDGPGGADRSVMRGRVRDRLRRHQLRCS